MAYEQLFVSGKLVDPQQLLTSGTYPCEWRVRILTGLVPDMGGRLLRHRKRFYLSSVNNSVRGVNVVRDACYWGHHVVRPGWGRDGRPATVLDYGGQGNTLFTRNLVDVVRTTDDPDLLIGKLYSGDWFGGYFTLARIR